MSRLLAGLTRVCHYSPYCLHRFSSNQGSEKSKETLLLQIEPCAKHGVQKTVMLNPDIENECILKFCDYSTTVYAPYAVYANFVSFIVPMTSEEEKKQVEDDSTEEQQISYSKKIAERYVNLDGCCYVNLDEYCDLVVGPKTYRIQETDKNLVEKMMDELLADCILRVI